MNERDFYWLMSECRFKPFSEWEWHFTYWLLQDLYLDEEEDYES